MITAAQADKIISDHIKEFPAVQERLEHASGRVLKEDLYADRDLPAFDRVMMDGIAVPWAALAQGVRAFHVEGVQASGQPALTLTDPAACFEVMTGAVLPKGCDCVIPYEDVALKDGKVVRKGVEALSRYQNVHRQGRDAKQGARLVPKGARMGPAQAAVAASVGKARVLVSRLPEIAVVSTGDELVSADSSPAPYQIRSSNGYALQTALVAQGYARVQCFHAKDDKENLEACLKNVFAKSDVTVLVGGVSMGKFDFVPEVLRELGVDVLFHKVSQRPGKPFLFGIRPGGEPLFALPGNPVSAQIGLYRYVLPYLRKADGQASGLVEFAALSENLEVKTGLTIFLPVKLHCGRDGCLCAAPVQGRNSGDFVALVASDGFVELPAGTGRFLKGTGVRVWRW